MLSDAGEGKSIIRISSGSPAFVHAFAALPVFGSNMEFRKPGRLTPVAVGHRKEVNHV
jgi:hypothetical protein